MAIIFDKEVSQTTLLGSHDDNIVEFHSDNPLDEVSCNVDFGSQSFDITPDPTGKFTYNLKEVVKTLINSNNFRDSLVSDIHNENYVQQDNDAYLAVSVTYRISFQGGTTESISRNYKFVKAVHQPIKYADNVIDTVTDKITILSPYEQYSKKSFYMPYFEGLPFDFNFYSNAVRNIIVTNKTVNLSTTLSVANGVNRIYVSSGARNWALDSLLPLVYGINQLEFAIEGSPTDVITLFLERHEPDCGVYFKYHNQHGGYSYYRCNRIYTEDLIAKTIQAMSPIFKSIEQNFESNFIFGKDSSKTVNLLIELKDRRGQAYLEEILDSPRVEMYLEPQFTRADSTSWLGVRILDGSFEIKNTKNIFGILKFKVGITRKTLTL